MNNYIDPLFQEVLDSVPQRVKGEVDRSFDLSSRIDALLREKGWTKSDLAEKTGRKCSEVSKWLSGTQNFTLRTIALIEEALGCELINVVGAEDCHNVVKVQYEVFTRIPNAPIVPWEQPRPGTKRSNLVYSLNQYL